MSRDTRSSYPASSARSPSPPRTPGTHNSSIFPYSTARPPTNYSAQSWLPHDSAPPVPHRHGSRDHAEQNPFGGIQEEEEEDEIDDNRETPLYARPDWEGGEDELPVTGPSTARSQRTFAGKTDAPTAAFDELYEGGSELGEEDVPPRGKGNELPTEVEALVPSPISQDGQVRSASTDTPTSLRKRSGYTQRSTLPSVVGLEHLTQKTPVVDPFVDPDNTEKPRQRSSHVSEPTPVSERARTTGEPPIPAVQRESPDLMSPAAQERLGRMSVAPARYTLPARGTGSNTSGSSKRTSSSSRSKNSAWNRAKRIYFSHRAIISAGLTVICAVLLALTRQISSGVSAIVLVPGRGFSVDAANGARVGLAASGWCQRDTNKHVSFDIVIDANIRVVLLAEPILTAISRTPKPP